MTKKRTRLQIQSHSPPRLSRRNDTNFSNTTGMKISAAVVELMRLAEVEYCGNIRTEDEDRFDIPGVSMDED